MIKDASGDADLVKWLLFKDAKAEKEEYEENCASLPKDPNMAAILSLKSAGLQEETKLLKVRRRPLQMYQNTLKAAPALHVMEASYNGVGNRGSELWFLVVGLTRVGMNLALTAYSGFL